MMTLLEAGLFEIVRPFSLMGLEVGNRSVIVQTEGSQVAIISATKLENSEVQQISSLGEVKALIIPNLFHHLFVGHAKEHFRNAKIYAPLGLEAKRPDLTIDELLPTANLNQFGLQCFPIEGMPQFKEMAFYHSNSQTLILTDSIFNLGQVKGLRGRILSVLLGTYNRTARSRLFNSLIQDRDAFRASLEPLIHLPKKRITIAHGKVLEDDCNEIFARLFT